MSVHQAMWRYSLMVHVGLSADRVIQFNGFALITKTMFMFQGACNITAPDGMIVHSYGPVQVDIMIGILLICHVNDDLKCCARAASTRCCGTVSSARSFSATPPLTGASTTPLTCTPRTATETCQSGAHVR